MKILIKLVLILALILPSVTIAAPSNTTLYGWVGYYESFGMNTIYSYKFKTKYSCELKERYDYYTSEDVTFSNGTYNSVFCKVRDYICTCIYY